VVRSPDLADKLREKMPRLTVSCSENEEQSGPTLVHSQGVPNYRIDPDLIRVLQEAFTNDHLRNDHQGVICDFPGQQVVDVLSQGAGLRLASKDFHSGRHHWSLTAGDPQEHQDEDEDE
ncbi:unnamed protein product, partial [Didymodactylos carnosus]